MTNDALAKMSEQYQNFLAPVIKANKLSATNLEALVYQPAEEGFPTTRSHPTFGAFVLLGTILLLLLKGVVKGHRIVRVVLLCNAMENLSHSFFEVTVRIIPAPKPHLVSDKLFHFGCEHRPK